MGFRVQGLYSLLGYSMAHCARLSYIYIYRERERERTMFVALHPESLSLCFCKARRAALISKAVEMLA